MLFKTHLVVAVFVGIVLLNFVPKPTVFFVSVVVANFIPDLDSFNSKLGKKFFSRVLTSFTKHRGIMHSFLFATFIYVILYLYLRAVSFGFLIGYGVHLICDSVTKQGVRIFYPFKFRVHGFLKTGGIFESFLFLIFSLADVVLIFKILFQSIF